LVDRRWDSSIQDARSSRGADCDTDHYLVVAKARKRLAVSKQPAQEFGGEIFCIRKLSDSQFRKRYQIKISKSFVDMENLSDSEEIIRAWENITFSANVSLVLYVLMQHKPGLMMNA